MSNPNAVPKRRRSIESERMTRQIRVTLPADLDNRLRALADRYNVAAGVIAREAIAAGLRSISERLRRQARSAAEE